ncbi:Tether containing UBX domain for GLUT4 [Coelomomyces lativittatus]|nr:Tether containing UBX domain for GLUT4 [Coelomomyces lativittatus]
MSTSIFLETNEGQRHTMKVTPMMPLTLILEQACAHFQLGEPHDFVLCQGSTPLPLDLSLTVRFANLPNGSKLRVVSRTSLKMKGGKPSFNHGGKSASSTVQVALQLPEGGRRMETFSSNTSLWQILEHFEIQSKGSLNLTKKTQPVQSTSQVTLESGSPPSEYLIPALIIMNRELNDLQELQSSTLSSLGITQSVLLRLHFKPSGHALSHDLATPLSSTSSPPSSPKPPLTIPSHLHTPLSSSSSDVDTSVITTTPTSPTTILSSSSTSTTTTITTLSAPFPNTSLPTVPSLPPEPSSPTSLPVPSSASLVDPPLSLTSSSMELERKFVLYAPPSSETSASTGPCMRFLVFLLPLLYMR